MQTWKNETVISSVKPINEKKPSMDCLGKSCQRRIQAHKIKKSLKKLPSGLMTFLILRWCSLMQWMLFYMATVAKPLNGNSSVNCGCLLALNIALPVNLKPRSMRQMNCVGMIIVLKVLNFGTTVGLIIAIKPSLVMLVVLGCFECCAIRTCLRTTVSKIF